MDITRDAEIDKVIYSQKSFCLVDSFLSKVEPWLNFRLYELRNLFYQTMAELLLSEIEILAWLIYIEETGLNFQVNSAKDFLIFIGLHAKISLGSDVKSILEKFKDKNPEIINKFEAWSVLNKLNSDISTKNLAKKYRELSMSRGISRINYNFYLNDILRSCTIYQKQTIYDVLSFSLEVKKKHAENLIFQVRKKSEVIDNQEYDLNEFDRIDI